VTFLRLAGLAGLAARAAFLGRGFDFTGRARRFGARGREAADRPVLRRPRDRVTGFLAAIGVPSARLISVA